MLEELEANDQVVFRYTDSQGQEAYEITASYSYTGGYDVYVMGQLIDSGELGDIPRTSETVLAVNEAQAINTGNG